MMKFEEHNEAIDLSKLKDFVKPVVNKKVKNTLNPIVWENDKMNEDIHDRLLIIAEDFFDGLELGEKVKYSDIILVGSMANFNWHRNSDFDVHIVIDFSQINSDLELVQEYLELQRKMWNNVHNIYIKGYPVELSTQGTHETIHSAGVYSILNHKWVNEPKHVEIPKGNEEKANKIANRIAKQIENIQYEYNTGEIDQVEAYQEAKLLWKKIKALRLGLAKNGEYDAKNLAFKKLRNDGYLEKITNLKSKAYDKIFSLDLHPELK
jgi:predicted nucleotidyltransferase